MPKVSLVWLEEADLEGLEAAAIASQAGVELYAGGRLEAAVVTGSAEQAPDKLRLLLMGKPVQWLPLGALVGGGDAAVRRSRAVRQVAAAAARAALGTLPPLYGPQPAQEVLVAGSGRAALAAARELAGLGHPVTLAIPGEDPGAAGADDDPAATALASAALPAQVQVQSGCTLEDLSGSGGAFQAWLRTDCGVEERLFGAVVVSPPGESAPTEDLPALDPGLCLAVDDLDPEEYQGSEQGWLHAALLVGPTVTAERFSRMMRAALALQERPGVQATVLFSEARVAAEGGERLYRQARQAGVLMVRVAPQDIRVSDDGRQLSWPDPLLGEDLELRPDVIVLDREITAQTPAWLDNPVKWPPAAWLAPEHARLGGGLTAVSGLFITGALRGTPPGAARLAEAASAAGQIHNLLGAGACSPPVVNTNRCAACLTCVRVCPHGVVHFVNERISGGPAACLACGICAAQCPAEAITPAGWSNPEMFAGLTAGLEREAEPKAVLFACRNSALDAAAELARRDHAWPEGLLIQPVNCAGRVGMQMILKSLALGAKAVIVAGCHQGNCRSITGNLRAALDAGQAGSLLEDLGLGDRRVSFVNLASNQPKVLASAVEEALS